MKSSKEYKKKKKKKQKLQEIRGCKALCCSCRRLSVSSSSEEAESSVLDRYASISSLAHAMVQERLDQMIKERQQQQQQQLRQKRRSVQNEGNNKFVVMVAMEKSSYDPRQDFRESMVEVIVANRLQDPKDLRSLLNYYMSMNSQDYHGIILEVFLEERKLLASAYPHTNISL